MKDGPQTGRVSVRNFIFSANPASRTFTSPKPSGVSIPSTSGCQGNLPAAAGRKLSRFATCKFPGRACCNLTPPSRGVLFLSGPPQVRCPISRQPTRVQESSGHRPSPAARPNLSCRDKRLSSLGFAIAATCEDLMRD